MRFATGWCPRRAVPATRRWTTRITGGRFDSAREALRRRLFPAPAEQCGGWSGD